SRCTGATGTMSTTTDVCFISVDIEASGPIPGVYSMLSVGACSVEHDQIVFKRFLRPISENFEPKAMEVSKLSLDALRQSGVEPEVAMREFRDWVNSIANIRTPVFVGL